MIDFRVDLDVGGFPYFGGDPDVKSGSGRWDLWTNEPAFRTLCKMQINRVFVRSW